MGPSLCCPGRLCILYETVLGFKSRNKKSTDAPAPVLNHKATESSSTVLQEFSIVLGSILYPSVVLSSLRLEDVRMEIGRSTPAGIDQMRLRHTLQGSLEVCILHGHLMSGEDVESRYQQQREVRTSSLKQGIQALEWGSMDSASLYIFCLHLDCSVY